MRCLIYCVTIDIKRAWIYIGLKPIFAFSFQRIWFLNPSCLFFSIDVLTKLLSGLDSSIACLYTNLLTPDSQEPHEREPVDLSKTMCEFFDLLEVLSTARLRFGVCSSVQRVTFVESRALLHVVRADVEYLVKKRALLLLKRSLLQRAGEDWASAEVGCESHEDHGLTEDVLIMAGGVLQEVTAGWLKEVPVKAQASFFGGNCDVSLGGTQKDDVILRAVSLILLKSLEINIQSPRWKGNCHTRVNSFHS